MKMYLQIFLLCLLPIYIENQKSPVNKRYFNVTKKIIPINKRSNNPKNHILSRSAEILWNKYKRRSGRNYKDKKEEKRRKEVFLRNKKYIEEHNRLADMGLKSYHLKLNSFADMTHEEFFEKYSTRIPNSPEDPNERIIYAKSRMLLALPETVDLREEGYVTEVRDQNEYEECASCWAFAAAGAIEGHLFHKYGKLLNISAQFFVDCDESNKGCKGGDTYKAFKTVKDFGMYVTEEEYPYRGERRKCPYNKTRKRKNKKTKSYVAIPVGDEETIMEVIATKGPVSAIFDSNFQEFQFMGDGTRDIFSSDECSDVKESATHGIIIVGYGKIDDKKYWLVKNSYGQDWGDNGYFKIGRDENMCGIANEVSYPIV